jgi:ribosome-binding protein aMBF1 (putative translation factor)
MEVQTLDQIKERYYGKKGTDERNRIEREFETLRIGLQIRNAREKKKMTQMELADKIEKKRSFISKMENDGSNMTIKTLFDIVERGLGGKLRIDVSV